MKVLVCGSRGWTDGLLILNRLLDLPAGTIILHGGAAGADSFAGRAAAAAFHKQRIFEADWKQHGKAAGIVRNLAMLDQQPDLVIAFWDGKSPGTKHTIREAGKRGIPVEVVDPPRPGLRHGEDET